MNKTENLKTEVANLIAEVERTHRYSMSRIYMLFNRVFETNELPQSCSSCLIRKVRRLKEWLTNQVDNAPNDIDVEVKNRKGKARKHK